MNISTRKANKKKKILNFKKFKTEIPSTKAKEKPQTHQTKGKQLSYS